MQLKQLRLAALQISKEAPIDFWSANWCVLDLWKSNDLQKFNVLVNWYTVYRWCLMISISRCVLFWWMFLPFFIQILPKKDPLGILAARLFFHVSGMQGVCLSDDFSGRRRTPKKQPKEVESEWTRQNKAGDDGDLKTSGVESWSGTLCVCVCVWHVCVCVCLWWDKMGELSVKWMLKSQKSLTTNWEDWTNLSHQWINPILLSLQAVGGYPHSRAVKCTSDLGDDATYIEPWSIQPVRFLDELGGAKLVHLSWIRLGDLWHVKYT